MGALSRLDSEVVAILNLERARVSLRAGVKESESRESRRWSQGCQESYGEFLVDCDFGVGIKIENYRPMRRKSS